MSRGKRREEGSQDKKLKEEKKSRDLGKVVKSREKIQKRGEVVKKREYIKRVVESWSLRWNMMEKM
jgi:hypothetical protein